MAVNIRCLGIYNSIYHLFKSNNKITSVTFRSVSTTFKPYYKMSGDQQALNSLDGLKLRRDVIPMLETFASRLLAEKWDNVGLLIEPATETLIKNIMLTNDLTVDVVNEAIKKNINLIISYHPPIFKPLKQITRDTWKGRVVALCLENKIAVYSPHTAWDAVHGGVTDWLADAFSQYLSDEEDYEIHPLIPNTDEELLSIDPKSGSGRIVYVKEISIRSCIDLIKAHTGLKNLRIALGVNKTLDSMVEVIVVVPGSGGTLLEDTIGHLFVTGEMSHHQLLDATHTGASVILTNHSDSERGFLKTMQQKLEKSLNGNANVIVSECDKDPIIYV